MIANKAGYDYITFLQIGKDIFEKGKPTDISKADKITKVHISLIPEFTNKEDAIEINQDLLRVDRKAPGKLESIKSFIKGILAGIPDESNKTGTDNAGEH